MSKLWNRIAPAQRKWVYLGGVGMVLVTVILVAGPDNSDVRGDRDPVIEHLLTDEDATKVTLQTLAAKIDSQRAEQGKLQRQMDQMRTDVREASQEGNGGRALQKELADLRAKLKAAERRAIATTTAVEEIREQARSGELISGYATGPMGAAARQSAAGDASAVLPFASASPQMREVGPDGKVGPQGEIDPEPRLPKPVTQSLEMTRDAEEFFRQAPVPRVTTSTGAPGVLSPGMMQSAPRQSLQPRSIHADLDTASVETKAAGVRRKRMQKAEAEALGESEEFVLPTGSIIEAIVLSGMDAPTNQGTRRDPFPALLRFKQEAILPSRYHADVRECFLIAAGYGDMSSERVFLRGETLSCGFEGGVFAEASLDSYAVGEDGKAGVRGRVVSRDGVFLSRALLAGFAEGISKAFDISIVPVVNTGDRSTENANVQTLNPGDAVRTGAVNGLSTAMEKLADRYLEMADQIFPVVELDAGRNITFIVTRPMRLQLPKRS